jgi:hypothetical protein
MKNEFSYQSEAEIIRQAEQQRSKAIAEFFSGLFSRDKHAVAPTHAVAAE